MLATARKYESGGVCRHVNINSTMPPYYIRNQRSRQINDQIWIRQWTNRMCRLDWLRMQSYLLSSCTVLDSFLTFLRRLRGRRIIELRCFVVLKFLQRCWLLSLTNWFNRSSRQHRLKKAMCNLITEYFSGVTAFTRRHEFSKKNQNFYKEISSVSLDPSPTIGYNFQSQQDIR